MNEEPSQSIPSEPVRTWVSLLLFMHLFCVAAVLGGSFSPSPLQTRLADTVSPYTRTLHLAPDRVTFQLTDGSAGATRLHQWQVIRVSDAGEEIIARYPHKQIRGGFNRRRLDQFAKRAADDAENEEYELGARMARAFAAHMIARQFPAGTDDVKLVVRCVRYVFDADISRAAMDSESFTVLYEADVWAANGELQLLRRVEPKRLAPPI